MLANLIQLIDAMSQRSEYKDGWKELERLKSEAEAEPVERRQIGL